MPGCFWSPAPELSKAGAAELKEAGEANRELVPGEAAARAPAHPAPATPGFLWDSQSAAETYRSVLRRRLGLKGAIQKGFKQPRAPEGGKKRARENHAQRRLNRLSELNI